MKKRFCLVMIAMLIAGNGAALASGSASGGFGQTDVRVQARQTDPLYDEGKAIYKGKKRGIGKIKYCLSEPETGELGKLRGKTVKPFRKGSVEAFAGSLVNCEMPDQQIATVMTRDDLIAVIYYLNKRYKLNLGA